MAGTVAGRFDERVNHRAATVLMNRMNSNIASGTPVPNDAGMVPSRRALGGDVATKLLAAWLANRRQTLMPHTLNFRALTPAEVALLIATMAAAAQAGGGGGADRHQAGLALALVNADPAEEARYEEALAVPQPVSRILDGIKEAGIGAHAYASALLVVDRSSPVAHAFLAYLAARWGLPPDLTHALESRYRV